MLDLAELSLIFKQVRLEEKIWKKVLNVKLRKNFEIIIKALWDIK